MPLPHPEPGLVISYGYLWRREHEDGLREGRKTRPCVIILAVEERKNGTKLITVAPITHAASFDRQASLELPRKVKQALGLDDARSWVVLDEVNQFDWPGFDLQPVPGHKSRYDYGFLPPKLFDKIKKGILALFLDRRCRLTKREE